MDKSNHTVTVPREYLEELEKFKEANRTDYNAKISMKNVGRGIETKYATFIELSESAMYGDISDFVIMVDKEGREISRFVRNAFFDKF